MKTHRLSTLLAASGLALASPAAPGLADEPPGESSALERAPVTAATQALERCRITRDAPAFTEMWTWTSAEQIEALRDGGKLLAREVAVDGRRSYFDQTLEEDLGTDHPLVKAVSRRGARPRRFGWVTPWATAAGSGLEVYGEQLVRVELEPDALIAVFTPREPTKLRWIRADGSAVSDSDADPSEVTAVYHEARRAAWESTFGPPASSVAPEYRYRELVLVSMEGVAGWSHGTEAARERLEADAARLADVRDGLDAIREENGGGELWDPDDVATWGGATPDAHPAVAAWMQCLAFPTTPYALEGERIDDLIVRVEAMADAQSAPVRGTK